MNPAKSFDHRDLRQLTATGFYRRHVVSMMLRCACVAGMLVAALSVRAQSVEIFMRIGGPAAAMGATQTAPTLAGESTDPQYTGWIPVYSMSHGVGRSVVIGSTTSTSSPNHSEVALYTPVDKTSPSIDLLVCGVTATVSQPIDYVTIDFRKSGSQVFYRMELQGVYFTSTTVSGSAGGSVGQSLSLAYTKIRWSYVPFDSSGKAQTTITKGWDVAKAASF